MTMAGIKETPKISREGGFGAGPDRKRLVIGVDFDNTLISYDEVMHRVAVDRGLIAPSTAVNKKAIRDTIRLIDNGEIEWQKVQALVYGPLINEARPMTGVESFLAQCARSNIKIYIVSHKTKLAAYDETGTDLREAALAWMRENGFFEVDEPGLRLEDVFFGSTRQEKIDHIEKLGCTHFIDDLEETFAEQAFPAGVKKVLFAPAGDFSAGLEGVTALRAWTEISDFVLAERLTRAAETTLGMEVVLREPLSRGRNSRVFKLVCSDANCVMLKAYFKQRGDDWDRQRTEYSCLSRLRESGVTSVPRPLAVDWELGYTLYEYIAGTPVDWSDIGDAWIDSAVDFLVDLKRLSKEGWSREFGPAAEACFSIKAIIENIEARLDRLRAPGGDRAAKADLKHFLDREFSVRMRVIVDWSLDRARQSGIAPGDEINWPQRTLSPSDFGFHNAVQSASGELVWVDFEYFGWDDPAKMISDVVLHPGMVLSDRHKRRFVQSLLDGFADPKLAARLEAVYPLFGLKWCMILLNEFLPEHMSRRRFAGIDDAHSDLLERQLGKARRMLEKISGEYENFPYRS